MMSYPQEKDKGRAFSYFWAVSLFLFQGQSCATLFGMADLAPIDVSIWVRRYFLDFKL
jgi:hypothetical protein